MIGRNALKLSVGLTRPLTDVTTGVGYRAAFYFLGMCLKHLSIDLVYPIWAGVSIVFVTSIGLFFLEENAHLMEITGTGMIVAGVLKVFIQISTL